VIQTIRNAWKIPELRKKILFTLLILLIYRAGNCVPVPFVNVAALSEYFTYSLENTVLGLYNAMSGNAFASATIFALSIQPYINASIILQLLCVAIPALERLSKEGGEEGKKKIAAITRYSTVGLGLFMGFAYWLLLKNADLLTDPGVLPAIVVIVSFTAGASLLMWLGEQITEFGIGNGISMILFASIISRIPSMVSTAVSNLMAGSLKWYGALLMVVGIAALIMFIVFINDAERRIPVQYAKRVVGRKMYGGQSTHLPIKVSMAGVLPVIFAQSIASLPATIAAFFPAPESGFWKGVLNAIQNTSIPYIIVYFFLIIGFAYFYTAIQFNPVEIANNLKKNGGFIPGFRPGRPTSEFINRVLNKVTLFGALYLAVVAILPIIAQKVIGVPGLSIGGTSVIIVVGVALETVKTLEAQMLMRNYKGFLE